MKKVSKRYLLVLNLTVMFAFNMAHPVTPRLITELSLPSFMFGIFFAFMSVATFVSSPIWGKLSDENGRKKYLIYGVCGYGISQIGFGFSKSIILIVIFRALAGAFAASYITVSMAYITDITSKKNRIKYLSYYSAFGSVGSSLGSLIGGIIGSNKYKLTFLFQFGVCLLISILINLFIGESIRPPSLSINKKLNIREGENIKINFNSILGIMIIAVALTSFATTSYNSTINYYVEAVLNLPPSIIGIVMFISGIIGLIMNFFVNPYLAGKFNEKKLFKSVVLFSGMSLITASLIDNLNIAIIFIITFLSFISLTIPIQQSIISKESSKNYGMIMGIQNSSKALGMVIGSLFSGFIFNFGSKLPFIIAGITLVSTYFMLIYAKKFKDDEFSDCKNF
ncbi:MFS transporter [Clostridium botulinum]|uniref:MFS transporter n=1 Tax=Clostridium botulinum TaxID=1491 RepID=A0A6B4JQT4_CLOBO|nr:MFS transporter [Clostridium botulinum]EES50251.1 transporter, major facilitator family [Clostridium botulinum E1 str. 'BoNT E Beluga']MBY6761197.1 MFS transporter [Clostridium botulinum]MBY6921325.1 MFS transporter [Clostridium botulinum]MCR1132112.1 MFS transporter [Clostridium botulinum]NFJ59332.1 MFS transporter [Clostridium botulinum]